MCTVFDSIQTRFATVRLLPVLGVPILSTPLLLYSYATSYGYNIGAHGPNHQWYELDAASQKSLNLDPASTEHPCWSREDGDASREALAKALNLGTDDWGGHEVRPYTEKV